MRAGEPTTDYVYATELQHDNTFGYYFEVRLEGNNFYTAYGIDIQLPARMEVLRIGEYAGVMMSDGIYPKNPFSGQGTHSLSSNFPYSDDFSHIRVACHSGENQNFTSVSGSLFKVYVTINYEDGKWPIGGIKLFAVELSKSDKTYFSSPDTETAVPVHTGETTLPLKVSSAAKWSTCILPFSAAIPDGVKAYTCSSNDTEYIYLTEAESFDAYTPYILYAENGFDGNVSGTVDATVPDNAKTGVVAGGYLNGAIVPQTVKSGYVLQKHGEDVKFYAIAENDAFAIPAGKCWMTLPDGNSNVLGFKTDDETAGINNVIVNRQSYNSISFDLSGRQQKMDKGVIIKNGKKTLSL